VLTKQRTRLVSTKALASMAARLELGAYVQLGRAEESNGGRERESTLADALEALIGAIFVDGGIEAARYFVLRMSATDLKALMAKPDDMNPKGQLQELLQSVSEEAPHYEIVASSGPDHKKHFDAVVIWRGLKLGQGAGARKKDAEAVAAKEALANPNLKSILATVSSQISANSSPVLKDSGPSDGSLDVSKLENNLPHNPADVHKAETYS